MKDDAVEIGDGLVNVDGGSPGGEREVSVGRYNMV